ncbi:MAG: UPF0164 family protein [Elusimicrobiales bacterium]
MAKPVILKIAAAAAAVALACQAVMAGGGAGSGAGAFMKLPIGSARGTALGHSYTALAEGADGLSWNPAALATVSQRELAFSHISWFQDYGGNYAAYAQPMGSWVVGVNFAYLSIDNFDVRDIYGMGGNTETVSVNNTFGSVALSRAFFKEKFMLGGALKRVSEGNDGSNYSSMCFDLGAKARLFDRLLLGMSLQNLGATGDVVQMMRTGAAWVINDYITVSGEIETPSDSRTRKGFGAEITLPESLIQVGKFSLRAGYFDNDDTGENYDDGMLKTLGLNRISDISLGAGFYSNELAGYGIGMDFAVAPYGALGKATQISVKIAF